MKKILVMLLALVMAISMLACASAATELKWASVHPPEQVVTQMMMRAIDEINEKAEGIHITGYPNGVLGGSSDVVEAVQEGMVEIITEGPAQFGTWIPKASQVEAPFLWQSVEHMQKALNGDYKDVLNELFAQVNVRILGSFYYGTRQLTTNKPIHTLDDLKGMKIRVPQAELYVKMVESWGAAATPMNINELYMALQTGTVDGQENPLTTFESYKFYEVVKNVVLTNHIICPNMIFMNADVWNSLSEHDQQVVQEAVDAAVAWQDEQIIEAEKTLADKLASEYGCEIITPDDTIRDATIPYIQPLIEDWDLIQSMA
ncbi:MAG: DctP family TRAP transporter solute-binding subunit [Clostridia bacterium]|nr:DctP family TRAP transporter solute-binding subunit [Clostridia bacterium]